MLPVIVADSHRILLLSELLRPTFLMQHILEQWAGGF